MGITFKSGDMFSDSAEALINTVNCVGVMGKGVALEFKKRWPDNYKAYKKICADKKLEPGKLFVFDNSSLLDTSSPKYLINFPTKMHWKSKSKISYVEDGLDALVKLVKDRGIRSVAMPPLGCGNGGLDWNDVQPLIKDKLSQLEGVDFIVYAPREATDLPEHETPNVQMTFERATLLKALGDLEAIFDGCFDRISLQKIAYFLQVFGINFQLKFSRNLYGPYSGVLKKAYVHMEKLDLISGFSSGESTAHVTHSAYALAEDFLQQNGYEDATKAITKLGHLIEGYESPYGLELLSSIHWLAAHEGHAPVEKIIIELIAWNSEKRGRFSENSIRSAFERLESDGILN